MSNTVFILGAGASATAGTPMMKGFLDVAEGLGRQNQPRDIADAFNAVFNAIGELQQAHSKSAVDLENVESVFAAFEMATLLRRLGNLSEGQIQKLAVAMRQVIETTIESTTQFPIVRNGIYPPASYAQLTRFLKEAMSAGKQTPRTSIGQMFSVITFNYDICVDYALHQASIPIRYCLGESSDEVPNNIALLKLHGSLNWGHCSGCNKKVSLPLAKYVQNRRWMLEGLSTITLSVASKIREFQHCTPGVTEGPFLVPPTWNKSQYHVELESVWQAAASELSTAENIFVCGYSLPDTDQFFKYLYALGTIGSMRLKRFWVFNPDEKLEGNFRNLLGQAVLPRFKFFSKKFEEMFPIVRPEFGLTSN